jgi:hypothetical protein
VTIFTRSELSVVSSLPFSNHLSSWRKVQIVREIPSGVLGGRQVRHERVITTCHDCTWYNEGWKAKFTHERLYRQTTGGLPCEQTQSKKLAASKIYSVLLLRTEYRSSPLSMHNSGSYRIYSL